MTGLGIIASYSLRFWTLVIGLGVVAGVSAGLLVAVAATGGAAHLRRTRLLGHQDGRGRPGMATVAGAAGSGRDRGCRSLGAAATPCRGRRTEVSEALWLHSGKLPLLPSLARGVLSIVIVGMGVSLGREGAPQLFGAAFASRCSDWARLPLWQRRLLVAAGAGAGFSAVYNVPLGGTLFALEVLLGTVASTACAAGAVDVADRDRGGLDIHRKPRALLRAGEPLLGVSARICRDHGAGHRPCCDGLDAGDRLHRAASSSGHLALAGAAAGLWHPWIAVDAVPAAAG